MAAPLSSLERWRRAGLYALAGGLLAFELGVLALAFFPRVPPAYVDYYIARETLCFRFGQSPPYRLGETIRFGAGETDTRICFIIGQGWDGRGPAAVQSRGARAVLVFGVDEPMQGPLRLCLGARAAAGPIGVLANDVPLGPLDLPAAAVAERCLPIPAEAAVGRSVLEVVFEVPRAGGDGRRTLKLRLAWVRVEPAS